MLKYKSKEAKNRTGRETRSPGSCEQKNFIDKLAVVAE